ncbi:hypothetical protein ES705_27948 [subsurface metagenome]
MDIDEDTDIAELEPESEPIDVDDSTSTEVYNQGNQKIRIGGFFGKTYTIKKEGDKIVYEKLSSLDNNERSHQVDVNETDSTLPLNLKKPEIPKFWSPSENRKRPTFVNCPGCGTQLKESDINKQSCSYCGFKLDT